MLPVKFSLPTVEEMNAQLTVGKILRPVLFSFKLATT